MWRKSQLNAPRAGLDVLVRAAELAGLTVDDHGLVARGSDLFRPEVPNGTGPMHAYVHVVHDDDLLSHADVVEVINDIADRLSNGRVRVTLHECIVFIPDFAEEDWLDDIWPAAERFHALEKQRDAGAVGEVVEELRAMRQMLAPLLAMENETSSNKLNWLGTMMQLQSGSTAPVPAGDGSAPASGRALMAAFLGHLRSTKK